MLALSNKLKIHMLTLVSNINKSDQNNIISYFNSVLNNPLYGISYKLEPNCIIIEASGTFGFDTAQGMRDLKREISRLARDQIIEEQYRNEQQHHRQKETLRTVESGYRIIKFDLKYFDSQAKIIKQRQLLKIEDKTGAKLVWDEIPNEIKMHWSEFNKKLQSHIVRIIKHIKENPSYLHILDKTPSEKSHTCTISRRYPIFPILVEEASATSPLKYQYNLTTFLSVREAKACPTIEGSHLTRLPNTYLKDILPSKKTFNYLKKQAKNLPKTNLEAAEKIQSWLKDTFANTNSSGLLRIISEIDKNMASKNEKTILQDINLIIKKTANDRVNGLCGLTSLWAQSSFFGKGRSKQAKNFYNFCTEVDNVFTNLKNFDDNFNDLKNAVSISYVPEETTRLSPASM